MSSYLVFSLKEKESGEFRDVTSYSRNSDQYQMVTDAIDVPNSNSPTPRAKFTTDSINRIRREIEKESKETERTLDTYRQTNNPSWDLFTAAQDYKARLETLKYLDVWCDTLYNIVYDIELSESFYEGVYIQID